MAAPVKQHTGKRILVIGSGGREHALSWKIARSPLCTKLYCAPGNGGMSEVAELIDIAADDIPGLLRAARDYKIDLVVVGPEVPLVHGIVDIFRQAGIRIFGPVRAAAQLEGSKVFAKEVMQRLHIPTAPFKVFTRSDDAISFVRSHAVPVVVKADGLCAGKGVVVCSTVAEAEEAIRAMLDKKVFGAAGARIVVEDCLVGEEASILALTDGNTIIPLASSQDHKRIFDGDKGPNTGGMGAYSPAPVVTPELLTHVTKTVLEPLIAGLAREGIRYSGVIYAGIMVTDNGPQVLEFNARFGDPETQVLLPRLASDLVEAMEHTIDGTLGSMTLAWDPRPCVSVVIASGGYPGEYEKGMVIEGLDTVRAMRDVVVFHAGTRLGQRAHDVGNVFLTNGGRVLNVTALGTTLASAIENCYAAVRTIRFERMHYRSDIAYRALKSR